MLIKGFKDEDFTNYRKPAMFIIMPHCSFKCDEENGCLMCQNSHLVHEPTHVVETGAMVKRYCQNFITKAVVFGGLEPFDTAEDIVDFLYHLRKVWGRNDDVVIYTGYEEWELAANLLYEKILEYGNIVIKYGRFRPNQAPHYDEVLGVNLASDNQYARRYD